MNKRSIAAKKAAKTRAVNRAMWERWKTIDEPAQARVTAILNAFVETCNIDVELNPLGNIERRLKKGVTRARIVKFKSPMVVRVLPVGYKRAMDCPMSFWKPIL